jgi:ankyrin repeat protein
MRKTMLFVMASIMLGVTSVSAEIGKKVIDLPENSTYVEMAEINSFCKAIIQGDLTTVKKLIELGEDVNRKSLGMTPAIFAARYNKAEILKLLIKNGADLKIRSKKGYSIAKYAESANAVDALAVINAELRS